MYKLEWLDQQSLKLDGLLSITLSNKNVHRLNKPKEKSPGPNSLTTDHILQGMWSHGQNSPTCDTSKFSLPGPNSPGPDLQ